MNALAATGTLRNTLRQLLQQPIRGLHGDALERWQAILTNLLDKLMQIAKEIDAIVADPRLTEKGKLDKLLAIGPRIAKDFQNLGVARDQADQAIARIRTLLFDAIMKVTGDLVIAEMRAAEIRATIGKNDAGPQYLVALNRGDVETARALATAPGAAWVAEDFRKRGEENYATQTNPEAWQQLQQVEILRDNLSAIAQQVASWLLLLGASPESVTRATGIAVPASPQTITMQQYLERVAKAN